jgi:soluble lytic murein transglycosylase-like protein
VCFFLLRYSVWVPIVSAVAVSGYQLYVKKKLTFKLSSVTVALFVFTIWDVWSPDEPSTAPARTPTAVATAPMPTGVAAARTATGVAATPTLSLSDVVREASERYRLDPDLLNSVIRVGSGCNPHAVSPKGAQGLMQLMPQTASKLGVPNAFDPAANVDAGARYLRELLERYNFDVIKALAAYYAGPEIVDLYGGVPPDRETRAYVASIVRDFNRKKIAQQKAAKADAEERAKANKKPDTSGTVDKPSAELLNLERLPNQVPQLPTETRPSPSIPKPTGPIGRGYFGV